MATKSIRDLLLYFALCGVPIASFLLQDYPNTYFYLGLLTIFLILLIWLRIYHRETGQLLDYDENLNFEKLTYVALGTVGVYFVASLLVSEFAKTSIYIPYQGLDVAYVGGFQLSGVWNDILFQLVLVAPSEELCKLVLHLALYMKLRDIFSQTFAKGASIGVPIFFWGMLHAYRAYTGPNMPVLILSALVGGLIIFYVMYKTKSLLSAILVHGGYNSLVLLMTQA